MSAAAAESDGQSSDVRFENVSMSFGPRPVLRDLTCKFEPGKVTVLLGGSGSGKTTLLRLIGGLIHPQQGRILVNGTDIARLREREMFRVRHHLGMMFQGGALLDSLTIHENLAFPLREHTGLSKAEIDAEVCRQLEAVGLPHANELLPGQLSGGMVKRAALARAMIRKPDILLCDEPFSGLDPISVKRIEALLHRMNRELGITMIISSHHIPSTMRLADRVLLLWQGKHVSGAPNELRDAADPQVAEFFNEEIDEAAALQGED